MATKNISTKGKKYSAKYKVKDIVAKFNKKELSAELLNSNLSAKVISDSLNIKRDGVLHYDILGNSRFKSHYVENVFKVLDSVLVVRGKISEDTSNISEEQFFIVNKFLLEAFESNDIITKELFRPVSFEELFLLDSLNITLSKQIADSFLASDTISSKAFNKEILNTLTSFDSRYFDINKTLLDIITATDDFLGEASLDDDQYIVFDKVTSNNLSTQDLLERTANFNRSFLETSVVSEDFVKSPNKIVNENIIANDSKFISLLKLQISNLAIQELLSLKSEKLLFENLISTEIVSKSLTKTLVDALLITDVISNLSVETSQENITNTSVADSVTIAPNKNIAEDIDFSENLTLHSQSYTSEDYFEEIYVGTLIQI
jgi:hypothetical protein